MQQGYCDRLIVRADLQQPHHAESANTNGARELQPHLQEHRGTRRPYITIDIDLWAYTLDRVPVGRGQGRDATMNDLGHNGGTEGGCHGGRMISGGATACEKHSH
jgi:hypothetical protein